MWDLDSEYRGKWYMADTENKTYYAPENVLIGIEAGAYQKYYMLREVEFVHIKNGEPKLIDLAYGVGLASFGYLLSLTPSIYNNITLTSGEKMGLYIGFGSAIFLRFVGCFLPNEKKKVMKDIDDLFKESPAEHLFRAKGDEK